MNAEARNHVYQADTIKFAGEYTETTKSFDMMVMKLMWKICH